MKQLYSSTIAEIWGGAFGVVDFIPCECGKSLEQSLSIDGTTLIRMSFKDDKFSQQVVCRECASEVPEDEE